MINIGDKIRNLKTGTTHIVQSIDEYENIELIFTEDIKYFKIDEVEKVPHTLLSELSVNIIQNKPIHFGLDNDLKKLFSKGIFKKPPNRKEIMKNFRDYKLKLGKKETITQKIKFYIKYYFL